MRKWLAAAVISLVSAPSSRQIYFLSFRYLCDHLQTLKIVPRVPLSPLYLLFPLHRPFFCPFSIVIILTLSSLCSLSSCSSPPVLTLLLFFPLALIIPPPRHLTTDNHPRRKGGKNPQVLSAATAAIHCKIVNEGKRLIAPPLSPSLLFSSFPPLSVNTASYSWCFLKGEKTQLHLNAPF